MTQDETRTTMLNLSEFGKWLLIGGLGLAALGALLWLLGHIPFLGNLPGDIRIQQGNFSCFVPLATMLLLSVLATIILNIIVRIINK